MIILGIVMFILYFLLCYYVSLNLFIWLNKSFHFRYKKSFYLLMFASSILFFIGELTDITFFLWWGYIWLVFLFYGILIFPLINLLSLKFKKVRALGFIVLLIYIFIFSYGTFNMWSTTVRTHEITVNKQSNLEELKILMVSDIHISKIIGSSHLKQLVELSKKLQPDIILIPGDVIDGSIDPYLSGNMEGILSELSDPQGVYITLGNHEYYGNDIPIFIEEMEKAGNQVLVDEVVELDELYIVGRKDYSDKSRLDINTLVSALDPKKTIISIDHQPREYDLVEKAGIDLMVSGHTHKGQLFPANLITNAMYENDWGYLKIENLHTVVSSGYGIWGPPFRIGSRSEVVMINLKFR